MSLRYGVKVSAVGQITRPFMVVRSQGLDISHVPRVSFKWEMHFTNLAVNQNRVNADQLSLRPVPLRKTPFRVPVSPVRHSDQLGVLVSSFHSGDVGGVAGDLRPGTIVEFVLGGADVEGTFDSVSVDSLRVGVVPRCPRVGCGEVVDELVSGIDHTLGNAGYTVGPHRAFLFDTVELSLVLEMLNFSPWTMADERLGKGDLREWWPRQAGCSQPL